MRNAKIELPNGTLVIRPPLEENSDNLKDLREVINDCQNWLTAEFRDAFIPYALDQIHATLVNAERIGKTGLCNLNFYNVWNANRIMAISEMLHFFRESGSLKFKVQIGGFADREYPFRSRREKPYGRSFSVQPNATHIFEKNGIREEQKKYAAVLIGWPFEGTPLPKPPTTCADFLEEASLYPRTLDALRRFAQEVNVLYQGYRSPVDTDNDFFFRLGMFETGFTPQNTAAIEAHIQTALSQRKPIFLEIKPEHVWFVTYLDNSLDRSNSRWRSLTEAIDQPNPEALYDL